MGNLLCCFSFVKDPRPVTIIVAEPLHCCESSPFASFDFKRDDEHLQEEDLFEAKKFEKTESSYQMVGIRNERDKEARSRDSHNSRSLVVGSARVRVPNGTKVGTLVQFF